MKGLSLGPEVLHHLANCKALVTMMTIHNWRPVSGNIFIVGSSLSSKSFPIETWVSEFELDPCRRMLDMEFLYRGGWL